MDEKNVPDLGDAGGMTSRRPVPEGIVQPELLAAIIENAPIPIFLKDPDGVYLYVNAAYPATRADAGVQLVGKTDADVYPQETAAAFRSEDRIAMQSSTPIQSTWPTMVRGQLRTFRTVKFPIRGGDGEVLGVCGISLDVTDTLLEQQAQEAERTREISGRPFNRLLDSLTVQEARVAELLLLGMTDRQIAETLSLTPDTVRHHVSHLLKKLRKSSRTEAVVAMLKFRKRS